VDIGKWIVGTGPQSIQCSCLRKATEQAVWGQPNGLRPRYEKEFEAGRVKLRNFELGSLHGRGNQSDTNARCWGGPGFERRSRASGSGQNRKHGHAGGDSGCLRWHCVGPQSNERCGRPDVAEGLESVSRSRRGGEVDTGGRGPGSGTRICDQLLRYVQHRFEGDSLPARLGYSGSGFDCPDPERFVARSWNPPASGCRAAITSGDGPPFAGHECLSRDCHCGESSRTDSDRSARGRSDSGDTAGCSRWSGGGAGVRGVFWERTLALRFVGVCERLRQLLASDRVRLEFQLATVCRWRSMVVDG